MNESEKNEKVGEAIVGMIFIFIVLVFLIYKIGGNKTTVSNPDITQQNTLDQETKAQLEKQLSEDENKSLYNKYVKAIYDTQNSGGQQTANQSVDVLVSSYQNDLLAATEIPNPTVKINNLSDKFSTTEYTKNFELLFAQLKKLGGTEEGNIFALQINPDGSLIPLSQYDKETILRDSINYELFANQIQNLPTPSTYEAKANALAGAAKNISYILKKMSSEDDEKIYSMWISKYAENMSAIIKIRYAIQ